MISRTGSGVGSSCRLLFHPVYQPTMFRSGERPVLNLDLPANVDPRQRRQTLQLIRGLLDSTLVLGGGAFGRSPEAQSGNGRDHHNLGFSMWMAGGGIRRGQVVGATDAIGLHAIEQPYHFRDIHTTILHQLGLDQHQLTYPHLGRNERLTFVEGKLIREIV